MEKLDEISIKDILSNLKEAFLRLNPIVLYKNSVIFYTYLGAIFSLIYFLKEMIMAEPTWLYFHIAFWLWFTVFITNFSECLAESRGRRQVESLRQNENEKPVKLLFNGSIELCPLSQLKKGDIILCQKDDIIPADGRVIEGIATIDESLVTGESAPVIRESGDERNYVIAGSKILSDSIKVEILNDIGFNFLDKIVHLIEGSKRQKTPGELALNFLLSALSTFYILAIISYKLFAEFSSNESKTMLNIPLTIPVLIAFFVSVVPTTIAALLNTIGISGMDRLIKKNIIAKSGRSIESASEVDFFILDKTGTLTYGNRIAAEFFISKNIDEKFFYKYAYLASFKDDTVEGRSIALLAKKLALDDLSHLLGDDFRQIPFSAKTRISGLDILGDKEVLYLRKGAKDAIEKFIQKWDAKIGSELNEQVQKIASLGGTPLVLSLNGQVLGVIYLKDVIKPNIKPRFERLRKMGVKTMMVTGDNPKTAMAIAAEIGVDDFIAEASSEKKLEIVIKEQNKGHFVAMAGDGINDAPALAQADIGIVMNTSLPTSKQAANMVDLDNDPLKLIEVIEVSKQLLMTRGALTSFSLSNDIAKYFAIIPALFGTLYSQVGGGDGPIEVLNIMNLSSPQSALVSAVIYNSLIIIALIPLSLKGVRYNAKNTMKVLLRNILIYGVGGFITPFLGLKIIDIVINYLGIV
jgi:K+-transporting ATPase ATPase B chain